MIKMKCPLCGAYEAVEIGDSQTLSIQLYCRSCGEKSYALRDEPFKEKERKPMTVSYKGFTGKLLILRKQNKIVDRNPFVPFGYTCRETEGGEKYILDIYDSENNSTHSFENVNINDVKFLDVEEKPMDEHSGTAVPFDEIAKKISEGKSSEIKQEDIEAIMKSSNFFDFWPFLIMTLFAYPNFGSSSADYWRGKYDAYKELHEGNTKEKNG